jgi:sodium/potassium-transporting ATPase subunit alpha
VLGFSTLVIPKSNTQYSIKQQNYPQDAYTFNGLIAMMDPPKPLVTEAIEQCRTAGIKVLMITGDHPIT